MKAICLAAGLSMIEETRPIPVPAAGEILIRVYATGVTPTELTWYPTTQTKSGDPVKEPSRVMSSLESSQLLVIRIALCRSARKSLA